MCRSEPQMLVEVILTMMSQGCSIFASGTSFTVTVRGPSYTAAFMMTSLSAAAGPPHGDDGTRKEPDSRKCWDGGVAPARLCGPFTRIRRNGGLDRRPARPSFGAPTAFGAGPHRPPTRNN